MKQNLSQVSQVIEGAKEVTRKGNGRNNSASQVNDAVLMETASNEELQAAGLYAKEETATDAKEVSKDQPTDALRAAVTDAYNIACANNTELAKLRAAVVAKEHELLVNALEGAIPGMYANVATDAEIKSLIDYGRTFTNNWTLDTCTRLSEGITAVHSAVVTSKNSEGKEVSKTAYAVAVDSSKFYPVTIVGRFRSFLEVARVVGLDCYAPFAAYDAKNKSKENARKALADALGRGLSIEEILAMVGK